jgi:hypothetical protein
VGASVDLVGTLVGKFVGTSVGLADGELAGTALSVTVWAEDGAELPTFDSDGTVLGLMDGSFDGLVSVGCWEELGAPVGGTDGSSLGDREEGATEVGLELGT